MAENGKLGSTILIVDDEQDLSRVLKKSFESKGLRVYSARDGESGLALARKHAPDLVVLDVILPSMDGMEFCRVLRQETAVPILFLTARKSEMDKVLGLKLGGDDYLTKPFAMEELLARIEALLRRTAPKAAKAARAFKRLGELEIDVDRHELRVRGKSVELTPKEFDLLRLLVDADGKVLSRSDLARRLWGSDGDAIGKRTVDQHVARLRRKLGTERRRILTVTNSGYRVRYD
jgi:DNA-binding response OmpR family regulator